MASSGKDRRSSDRALTASYGEGSKCFLIGQHWYRMKEALTFNRERVLRLCSALQVTPRELAMMTGSQPHEGDRWIRGKKITRPVAIHLLMFERAAIGAISPMASESIFPTGIIGVEEVTK